MKNRKHPYAVSIPDGHANYAPPGYSWSPAVCPIYAPDSKTAVAKWNIWNALCNYIGDIEAISGHQACGGCDCTSAMKRSKGIFRKVYSHIQFGCGQLPEDEIKSFQEQKDLAILTLERIIKNLNQYRGKESGKLIKIAYHHLHKIKEIELQS